MDTHNVKMVLSADQIKKEKDCDMDSSPGPCSNTPTSPQDLSMKSSESNQQTNKEGKSNEETAENDIRNHPQDQGNSRKLTNFFIDDILRSDFGVKSCCHELSQNLTSENIKNYMMSRNGPNHMTSQHSTTHMASPHVTSHMASQIMTSHPVLSPQARYPLSFTSPILSFTSSLAHQAKFASSSTRFHRNDILTPPPSSPESSSSSSSLSPRSSFLLSSPSSSSSSVSPRSSLLLSPPTPASTSLQSPKKEARGSSGQTQQSQRPSTSTPEGSKEGSNPSSPTAGQVSRLPLPAWVYCTRYSDRPSSGPRYRKPRQSKGSSDKRPRTAFSSTQLQRLRSEFQECPYLSEARRLTLARELGLTESQVKIWFQNKRAKLKKGCGVRNPLAQLLMEEGLYNHSTIVVRDDSNDDSQQNPATN